MAAYVVPNPWGRWSARAAAGFFAVFAVFQVALALGAPLGFMAWGGQSAVLPDTLRRASGLAAAILLLAAAVMLVRSGDWGRTLTRWPVFALNLLLIVQLLLNTGANLASRSEAERLIMGGATIFGATLCILAAVLARPVRVDRPDTI